ncbi:hypothetical protein [uncultured Salinibacterium sp.]|mgnify:CR=1 FL=1|uniref:hypothetical protein n=1 Tax=uncultured Salinibacterium sp. TaxID=459274 RepID=UPI0030D7D4E5|tara:strand:+ start:125932 stop:126213 length:282 start_codon:yes stop_codon:yes gene_type:complete
MLALVALPFLLGALVIGWIWEGAWWLVDWFQNRKARRIARIEAELDRTQAELRQTILRLADELGGNAHEARKALIRESYLASGQVPRTGASSR